MPYAIIDLGTNTFQLLIVERTDGGFCTLHEESRAAKIGKGGISDGRITGKAIERALTVLTAFRVLTDAHGIPPEQVRPVATSAVRNARNGAEFVQRVREATDFRVEVIDGAEEAGLIYEGVRLGTPLTNTVSLIMDIGGGSVEFILCNQARIFWKQSFEIGGQRLMDRFMAEDPIAPVQVGRLHDYLAEQLLPLTNAIHQYAPTELIGSAGSFETLVDLSFWRRFGHAAPSDWISEPLPLDDFYRSRELLLSLPRAERLTMPGMIELRVDMIVVGVCLIDFVLKAYRLDHIRVSTYALKEGVLAKLLKNEF